MASDTPGLKLPGLPPGPLRDLKVFLYDLYLGAGAPSLDDMATWAADSARTEAPNRDTISRYIQQALIPPDLGRTLTLVHVLAQHQPGVITPTTEIDTNGEVAKARKLWLGARKSVLPGRPIGETNPLDLGVHRAFDMATQAFRIPTYVPRPHDQQLSDLISMVSGQPASPQSCVAVIAADSSSGKTRSAWEAVRQLPADWRLWRPENAASRTTREVTDFLPTAPPRTVVWLDDAHNNLLSDDPAAEELAAAIRKGANTSAQAPLLIVITTWSEPVRRAKTPPPPDLGVRDRFGERRLLLAQAVLAIIWVPDDFSAPDDRDSLRRAAADDPQLAAITEVAGPSLRVAQLLAGGPQVLERYEHLNSQAALALINTTIDAHRIGWIGPIPAGLLETGSLGYLSAEQRAMLDHTTWASTTAVDRV